MLRTVDADVILELVFLTDHLLACGLSSFYSAVVAAVAEVDLEEVATAVEMTVVSGSSSFSFSVVAMTDAAAK